LNFSKQYLIGPQERQETHSQAPNCRSSGQTEVGSKSQSLENISTATDTTVDGNRDFAFCNGDNFMEDVKRRRNTIKLAATVV
jgi:hypothetical protein